MLASAAKETSESTYMIMRVLGLNVLWVALNRVTSFVTDRKRYSSSSTVPFRPEPTLRSIFLFEREDRLDHMYKLVPLDAMYVEITDFDELLDIAEGATVYRVNVVGAIDTSVITSTLCKSTSSVP